jgi:hypothetical protein
MVDEREDGFSNGQYHHQSYTRYGICEYYLNYKSNHLGHDLIVFVYTSTYAEDQKGGNQVLN